MPERALGSSSSGQAAGQRAARGGLHAYVHVHAHVRARARACHRCGRASRPGQAVFRWERVESARGARSAGAPSAWGDTGIIIPSRELAAHACRPSARQGGVPRWVRGRLSSSAASPRTLMFENSSAWQSVSRMSASLPVGESISLKTSTVATER